MSGDPCLCLRCQTRKLVKDWTATDPKGELVALRKDNPENADEEIIGAYVAVSLFYVAGEFLSKLDPFDRLVMMSEATAAFNAAVRAGPPAEDHIGPVAGSC
ncbi:hypothetical protein [Microvirga sp. Mcv34]|uniref:hypothetical protein n=1 Tax=Microvirga sp. Mcv34 TaxID=2926016 RepID=UPI0021C5B246|nr:hypothetical protein [Microvirga sp. Mcv34]